MRLILLSLLITWFMESLDQVIGCTVTPSAAAVLAGDSISVTCRPTNDEVVSRWVRQNENKTVYQSPVLTNRFIDDRYSVNDTNPNEIILTLQNASVQFADNYVCACLNTQTYTTSRDDAYISVIETEPQFTATNSLSSDDPVILTCSLKFAGNATLLIQITNSAENIFAKRNEKIITNGSQQFNLYYNTSSAIGKMYFCSISLASDASDLNTTIFSRSLATAVQFSVRNVSISPESPERCQSGGLCETGSVILCKAEGNPEPSYSFTIYRNGTIESSKDTYAVKYVGQQVIQCTASNVINGKVYSNSINFTTNVTEESVGPNNDGPNVPLIVGLVVGLGGGLLLILIILVIIICCKRQKHEVYKRNEDAYTRPQAPQSPNEREPTYTDLNPSNDVQANGERNANTTSESYDYVIR